MESLAKDGSFWSSSGAGDGSLNKLRFLGADYDLDTIMVMSSAGESGSYYIHDAPVDKQMFYNKWDTHNKFENGSDTNDVDWYDFTPDNIAQYIANRPASLDPEQALSAETIAARQQYLDSLAYLVPLNPNSYYYPGYGGQTQAQRDAAALKYYQAWDAELNKIYQLLTAKLSADDMAQLKTDEIQWIALRDQQAAQVSKSYSGQAYADEFTNTALGDLTRNRTYRLIGLYFGDHFYD